MVCYNGRIVYTYEMADVWMLLISGLVSDGSRWRSFLDWRILSVPFSRNLLDWNGYIGRDVMTCTIGMFSSVSVFDSPVSSTCLVDGLGTEALDERISL